MLLSRCQEGPSILLTELVGDQDPAFMQTGKAAWQARADASASVQVRH